MPHLIMFFWVFAILIDGVYRVWFVGVYVVVSHCRSLWYGVGCVGSGFFAAAGGFG